VKWLEAQKPPPRAPETREGWGRVTASFQAGSAVLAGPDGELTLTWDAKTTERALPPGEHRVRTTRIEREKDGVHWLVSQAGKPEPELVVKEGEAARLAVDETVRFEGKAKRHGRALQLGFSITGADGRGLSVYKNDKRVPVAYKVVGAHGDVLAEGTMNYG
jgi:hypothetical protein